ncbi:hypothetical protein BGZ49_006527 [Haplosporangium sp. Z 27]|nr:hypothetical protein BGZ49_006527 [Haplosporangium sp. Z 27]
MAQKAFLKYGSEAHLVCSSGGNAGLAVAYSGRQLGVRVTIVVPLSCSEFMMKKIQAEGANVEKEGEAWDEADLRARAIVANDPHAVYIPPFDHSDIWEGNKTMIPEIKVQLGGIVPDAIICCVGGGGLMNGVILGCQEAGWSKVPILAVETHGANSFQQSVLAGELITLPKITSIATTLGAKRPSAKSLELSLVHPVVPFAVSDAMAAGACWKFLDDHRFLVETSCGASLSIVYTPALLSNIFPNLNQDSNVVIVVCGGSNIHLEQLNEYKEMFGSEGQQTSIAVRSGDQILLKMTTDATSSQKAIISTTYKPIYNVTINDATNLDASIDPRDDTLTSTQSTNMTSPGSGLDMVENPSSLITKRKIQEMVAQIDPSERLEPEVEDILLELADEFIESVTQFASRLATHRKSSTLEVKDVQLHLERNWNIRIPGFASEEIRSVRKSTVPSSHTQKVTAVNNAKATLANSANGRDPDYIEMAKDLGREMLKRNYGLVYGGGSHGLMGAIAQTIHEGGGKVIGVIPDALKKIERPDIENVNNDKIFGEEIVVKDMHTRKALMNKLTSAFITLPGGYGTMEELLEITTWSQLNIHSKPVVLFNMKGYFEHLLKFIEHSVEEKFVIDWSKDIIVSGSTAEEVLDKLETYKLPGSRYGLKWDDNEEKQDFV